MQIPLAVQSNASVCNCFISGIAGLNPAEGKMFISCVYCVVCR